MIQYISEEEKIAVIGGEIPSPMLFGSDIARCNYSCDPLGGPIMCMLFYHLCHQGSGVPQAFPCLLITIQSSQYRGISRECMARSAYVVSFLRALLISRLAAMLNSIVLRKQKTF